VPLMRLLRFWPLAVLLITMAAAWASGLVHELGWQSLARHQAALVAWVGGHPVAAPAAYVAAYAVAAALSLPEAAVLTVAGGLLFGTGAGGLLAVAGSSLGSTLLFVAVRHHLADAIAARGGRFADRVRAGLERNGFSYMLAIRLAPVFPFWLVNLGAALSGMRLLPFAAATVIGIMPATFIYASIGAGLNDVLSAGGRPDMSTILTPNIIVPLVALAALSLLPIAWRHWKRSDA